MVRNNKLLMGIFSLVLLCFVQSAQALSGVSRACRFGDLPTGTKTIAAEFFVALGADPSNVDLPNAPDAVQRSRYILESITTDYGRVRYFLYATSAHYYKAQTYTGPLWKNFRTMKTSWTSEQVSDAVKAHPTFRPYYYNRGPLFSARAGAIGIIEEFGADWQFKVRGRHFYYDANSGSASELPPTSATDCNLTDWGIGYFNR